MLQICGSYTIPYLLLVHRSVGSEVLSAVTMKDSVFCYIMWRS
jgi:hypothetical protein